jgi:hypothetical protein
MPNDELALYDEGDFRLRVPPPAVFAMALQAA